MGKRRRDSVTPFWRAIARHLNQRWVERKQIPTSTAIAKGVSEPGRHVSPSAVRMWLAGEREPSADQFVALCGELGVELAEVDALNEAIPSALELPISRYIAVCKKLGLDWMEVLTPAKRGVERVPMRRIKEGPGVRRSGRSRTIKTERLI